MNSPAPQNAQAQTLTGFVSQLRNYTELMRLNKPIGILLLLWPTLWALWLAGEGRPDDGGALLSGH